MFRPRIIPVLLLKGAGLVKSIRFKDHRYIGDPINAVRIFNDHSADEIIILDITASSEARCIDMSIVREVGEEANMPFSVGGGIRDLQQIEALLKAGAEKVILNSHIIENTAFIQAASDAFGSSTIVVCVDVKKNIWGDYRIYQHKTKKLLKGDLHDFLKSVEEMGAGEIVLQSVDQDGMMSGFDLKLYQKASEELSMPLVALGGAGKMSDMSALWEATNINALAAGSQFVYFDSNRGVLINYPSIEKHVFRQKF